MFDDDSFGLDLEDLKNDSFMNHLNSTLLVKRDYELHEYDYEWLEIIEETMPYLDNMHIDLYINSDESEPENIKRIRTRIDNESCDSSPNNINDK